ncbi:MAG TPA: hypothetical protein VGI50_10095 [Solirubrobacteraceae bacterium]|jgi:hypothetical protein
MSSDVPFIAGAALALAELAFSLFQPGARPGLQLLAWAAAAGLGGVLVSALVLLAATPGVGRSLVLTVVGTLAALVVVALLSRLWMRG